MKKMYMVAAIIAALALSNKTHAQKHSDDNENSRLKKNATFYTNFGIGGVLLYLYIQPFQQGCIYR